MACAGQCCRSTLGAQRRTWPAATANPTPSPTCPNRCRQSRTPWREAAARPPNTTRSARRSVAAGTGAPRRRPLQSCCPKSQAERTGSSPPPCALQANACRRVQDQINDDCRTSASDESTIAVTWGRRRLHDKGARHRVFQHRSLTGVNKYKSEMMQPHQRFVPVHHAVLLKSLKNGAHSSTTAGSRHLQC